MKCRACQQDHPSGMRCETWKRLQAKQPSIVVANVVANNPEVVANSRHGKYADLEKRKAYQREYMRKKRAKA